MSNERDRLARELLPKYATQDEFAAFEAGFTAGENSERVKKLVEALESIKQLAELAGKRGANMLAHTGVEIKMNEALTQFKGGV